MKKEKKGGDQEKSSVKELNPPPSYIADRLVLWDKLKKQYEDELATKPATPIKVTLPDGKVIDATAWKTTVYDVAKGIRYVFV